MTTTAFMMMTATTWGSINELIHDIFPHVEFFLKETGYKLVDEDGNEIDFKNLDKETDADSSATE